MAEVASENNEVLFLLQKIERSLILS